MKNVTLFSILATLVAIAAAIFSLTIPARNVLPISKHIQPSLQTDSINQIWMDIRALNMQSSSDTMSGKEYEFLLNDIQDRVAGLKEHNAEIVNAVEKEEGFTTQIFWIKVIFSSIFCLAALFVVLSKKYDDETKKWAFSVLTLIAGVWIGTIS